MGTGNRESFFRFQSLQRGTRLACFTGVTADTLGRIEKEGSELLGAGPTGEWRAPSGANLLIP